MARKTERKWMQRAFGKHPGKLHRRLRVPEGQRIPAKKLARAAKSRDPELRREVALARTGKRYAGKRAHKREAHRSSSRS